MTNIKLDTTLNIPNLMAIFASVISMTVFIMNIKSAVKTQGAQIIQLTQEVGEIRRLHLKTVAITVGNETDIKANTKRVKQITKSLQTAGVKVPPIEIKPPEPEKINKEK